MLILTRKVGQDIVVRHRDTKKFVMLLRITDVSKHDGRVTVYVDHEEPVQYQLRTWPDATSGSQWVKVGLDMDYKYEITRE